MKMVLMPRFFVTFPADLLPKELGSLKKDHTVCTIQCGSAAEEFNSQLLGSTPKKEHLFPTKIVFINDSFVFDSVSNAVVVQEDNQDQSKQNMCMVADKSCSRPGYARIQVSICGGNDMMNKDSYLTNQNFSYPTHLRQSEKELKSKVFMGHRCNWPNEALEWFTRERPGKWPPQDFIKSAEDDDCFLIARPHPCSNCQHTEWQFVFPITEVRLAKEVLTEEQRYCFRVFKALVDFSTRFESVRLSTTHLKSVLYRSCEALSTDSWVHNPGGCVVFLLDRLFSWIRMGFLPNYFITANNMIDHFSRDQVQSLRRQLYAVRTFPLIALTMLADNHNLFSEQFLETTLEDMQRYRHHYNLNQSIADTFLPNCLIMFKVEVRSGLFKYVLNSLLDAYITKTAYSPPFNKRDGYSYTGGDIDFDNFYLEVMEKEFMDIKGIIAYEIDQECGSSLLDVLRNFCSYKMIKDILNVEDCLEYGEVPVPCESVDTRYHQVKLLEDIASHFNQQKLYEKCAHFLRCAIQKVYNKTESSADDSQSSSDVNQPGLDSYIESTSMQINSEHQLFSYALLRCYHDLYSAYRSMGQAELMQEYIEDYEAVCFACGYTYHYARVASIWEKLGNKERAQSIRMEEEKLRASRTPRESGTYCCDKNYDDVD